MLNTGKNFYDVLGVKPTSDTKDIKKAYKRLATKYHPDKNHSDEAIQKFQEIREAYDILSDTLARKRYDALRMGAHTSRTSTRSKKVTEIFISLLDSYMGALYNVHGTSVQIPRGVRTGTVIYTSDGLIKINVNKDAVFKRANDDLLRDIEISAIEAMIGAEVTLRTLGGKRLKFKIPAGTQNGQVIKLSGNGMPNPEFPDVYGDLLIRCNIFIPKDLTEEHRVAIMTLPHRNNIEL